METKIIKQLDYNKINTVLDKLDMIKMFNQRAGRELWFDKNKEIQNEDIKNVDKYLNDTIILINTLVEMIKGE